MANIKRNLGYNFLLSCTQVLIPLISIPYISRVLDPEGIGRVGFIDSFTYYIIVIAEFGITTYGIREVAKVKNDPAKLKELVSELTVLHIVSSLGSLVIYALGVYLLWQKINNISLFLFSFSFLLANFFSFEWYFWGKEKFRYITFRTIVVRLLGLLSIFMLVEKPGDYFIYYGIIVISAIITIVWNSIVLSREINISFKKVNWKKHLPYVWVTYLINIVYSIPLMLDNVLLRLVGTASAVGIYSFSVKIVRIGTNLLADSFLVFLPRIVSLNYEAAGTESQKRILQNVQFIILFSIPLGAGIFLLSDVLTGVFFGDKFMDAADDLKILSMLPFVKGISLFFSNPVLIAHHKERNFLRNLLGSSFIFLVGALILGYYYSHFGACIALIITESILLALNFISIKKELPALKIFDGYSFAHAIMGSLLFVPIIYLIRQGFSSALLQLIVSIAGCFLIYIVFITYLARNSFALSIKSSMVNMIKRTIR